MNMKTYSLFPDGKTLLIIFIISFITHKLAAQLSIILGDYFDKLYQLEGFHELTFKGVVLIMQSPVIFIFGLYLGKQLS